MKNFTVYTFLFALILAVNTITCPAYAEGRVLIYSDHEPLGNMRTTFLHEILFPNIAKESGGRLTIEEHWNSELSTGYDALNKTKTGEIDLAVIVPEYDSVNLPLHQLFKSFPIGPSGNEQADFFRSIYRDMPDLKAELEKQNLVPVYVAMGYPVAFYSTRPIQTVTNLEGRKWRSASFWHKDQLKNVGATPVTIPWGEQVYSALQDDQLDGLMVNIDSGFDINAQKIAPYILTSKKLWLGHIYIIAFNKNVWDSLSKKEKKSIRKAAAESYKVMGSFADSAFDEQIEALKNDGADVRFLTDKEILDWKQATRFDEIQARWISEKDSQDRSIFEKILKKISSKLH